MREITYNLLDDVNIGDKDIKTVRLCAPTMAHMNVVSKLQQGLTQAQLSIEERQAKISSVRNDKPVEVQTKDDESFDLGPVIIMMLKGDSTKNESYSNFCNTFKELLLLVGICYVDGSKKLGSVWLDRFSIDDFEKMMGEYITNFLVPSQK